jgi:predicted TIM-barrel fold metal-dependent hydrolase
MIEGFRVVDAHVHPPLLDTLSPAWTEWADEFSRDADWRAIYDEAGVPVPDRFVALLDAQGVDAALLFCEYSPRTTGIQRFDDLLPLVAQDPVRLRPVANVNPHLHWPIADEVCRQLDLGAVAVKLHPVHGVFQLADPELAPLYAVCQERGVPVIVHTGTSTFPGARSAYGNPEHIVDVVDIYPDLTVVLAHGGRGLHYDAAAFLALSKPNVWLDLAGLPPKKLAEYYRRFDLRRLARRWIFATDWPGVPGTARNVRTLIELARAEWGWTDDLIGAVLSSNAETVFAL